MTNESESPLNGSIEEQLATVLACAPVILWAADTAGTITLSTGSGLASFGIEPGAVVGQSLWSIHADRPEVLAAVREAMAGRRTRSEVRIDGRWLVGEVVPLRDGSGTVVGVLGVTMDVTDQTEAERASRESDTRYRQLVEELPDAVWTADAAGRLVFLSPAVSRMTGYPREAFLRGDLSIFDLVHPEDAGRWLESMRRLFTDDEPLDIEARLRARDGGWVWIRNRSISRYERDGKVWVDGIATDVTRAKRAEEALRREEQRLRSLIDSMPDVMWTATRDGQIVYISDSRKFPGHAATLAPARVGDRFVHFVHPDDRPAVHRAWVDLVENARPLDVEFRASAVDGRLRHLHARACGSYTRDGRVLVDGITSDVTQRRADEHALRESEERFRQLAEHTDVVYCLATVGLNEILYVNPAYETLFGRTCESLYRNPHSFLEALPAEDRELSVRRLLEQHDGRFHRDELRVIRPDGEVRWMSARAYPIRNAEGEVYRVAILAEDITEIKQESERQEVHRHELERAVRARTREIRELERERAASENLAAAGRMAARIAHEINNPLAGVRNAFLLVKDAVPDDHPHHPFVARIEHEIDRIADIVRQMYDLYPQDARRAATVDVAMVVRDVLELIRTEARERRVRIDADLPDEPCRARLVEGELRQVLYNLVHNALDASAIRGTVHVRVETEGENLVIRVRDEGEGIPEVVRGRVFEPFFTTKPRTGRSGLGLGLSVSKGLVERMGGRLSFRSREGEGTEFRVELPL